MLKKYSFALVVFGILVVMAVAHHGYGNYGDAALVVLLFATALLLHYRRKLPRC